MATVYELIGRAVVRLIWVRYGRQLSIAGAVLGTALVAAGWVLAKRTPPEG